MYYCEMDTPVVETDSGKIRGYYRNDLYHFYGIPYARAERFRMSEPCENWEDILDTQSFGYTCPVLSKDLGKDAFLHPHRWWIENENCLNLNVVTRNAGGAKRPVLVWIHGGAYSFGSAISSFYASGENFARNKDVVHVGINHRLNILGFLDLSEYGPEYENSAVLGVLDILAALKWIRKNIEHFGGDPDNVTLMGNSGGGGKIQVLMQMKEADGLYHKVIISSGNIQYILPDGDGSSKPLTESLLKELNLNAVKDLETVSFQSLADAYNKVSGRLAADGCYIGARPKPCGLYPGNGYMAGFRKENINIPILVGNTYGEFNSLMPLPEIMQQEPEKMLAVMLGDRAAVAEKLFAEGYPERELNEIFRLDVVFRQGTIDFINSLIRNGQKVYNYQFVLDFPYKGKCQAWHCSDLPFLLENTESVPVCDFQRAKELEKEMSDALYRFLVSGEPGWFSCRTGNIQTMYFGDTVELKENADIELATLLLQPTLKFFRENMK